MDNQLKTAHQINYKSKNNYGVEQTPNYIFFDKCRHQTTYQMILRMKDIQFGSSLFLYNRNKRFYDETEMHSYIQILHYLKIIYESQLSHTLQNRNYKMNLIMKQTSLHTIKILHYLKSSTLDYKIETMLHLERISLHKLHSGNEWISEIVSFIS